MTVPLVAQSFQFILAPVVMISATGLLLLGILGRYAAVNDRIRLITHERLDLLRSLGHTAEPFERERLREVDAQLPMLVRRLRRLHDCVLALDSAVVVFILDMFVIAGAAATGQTAIATLALAVFLAGNTAVLVGSVLGLSEVMAAQHAVEYEVERVLALTDDKASPHRNERS